MLAEVLRFDDVHHLGEPATRPLSGWRNRLAALFLMKLLSEGLSRQKTAAKSLLILAGSGHARHRALPDNPADPHSDASNRGIKVEHVRD